MPTTGTTELSSLSTNAFDIVKLKTSKYYIDGVEFETLSGEPDVKHWYIIRPYFNDGSFIFDYIQFPDNHVRGFFGEIDQQYGTMPPDFDKVDFGDHTQSIEYKITPSAQYVSMLFPMEILEIGPGTEFPNYSISSSTSTFTITAIPTINSSEIYVLGLSSETSAHHITGFDWISLTDLDAISTENKPLNVIYFDQYINNSLLFHTGTLSESANNLNAISHIMSGGYGLFEPITIPDKKYEISIDNQKSMSFKISSHDLENDKIVWQVFKEPQIDGIHEQFPVLEFPIGEYVDCSDPFVFNGVGGNCINSDQIQITAINDTDPIYLSFVESDPQTILDFKKLYNDNELSDSDTNPVTINIDDVFWTFNHCRYDTSEEQLELNLNTESTPTSGAILIQSMLLPNGVKDIEFGYNLHTPNSAFEVSVEYSPNFSVWSEIDKFTPDTTSNTFSATPELTGAVAIRFRGPNDPIGEHNKIHISNITINGYMLLLDNYTSYVSNLTNNRYDDHYTNLIEFLPKRIRHDVTEYTEQLISLSAIFADERGNEDSSEIPSLSSDIYWTIDTTDNLNTNPFDNNNEETGKDIQFDTTSTDTLIYNLTAEVRDDFNRTPHEFTIYLNDNIAIDATENSTSSVTLYAIYENIGSKISEVNPDKTITWSSDTDIISITPNHASSIGTQTIAATGAELSATHIITLSGNADQSTEYTFRPYKTPTSLHLIQISGPETIGNQDTFEIRVLGESNNTFHNLPPNTPLNVDVDGDSQSSGDIVTVTITKPTYDELDGYIPTSFDVNVSTDVPQVSGQLVLDVFPHLGDDIYNVSFQVGDNNPAPLIHLFKAEDDENALSTTINISDNSIADGMDSDTGSAFLSATNTNVTIALPTTSQLSFSDTTELRGLNWSINIPDEVEEDFDIILTVTVDYNEVPVTRTYRTNINIVKGLVLTPDDVLFIPEYKWDGDNRAWELVIDIDNDFDIKNSPPPFIYGNGRSEHFVLSATSSDTIDRYEWEILRSSGHIPNISNQTHRTSVRIETGTGNEIISARLIPIYENNIQGGPVIKPFEIKQVSAPTQSPVISIPSPVPSPGNIQIDIDTPSNNLDVPVIFDLTQLSLSTDYWDGFTRNVGIRGEKDEVRLPVNTSETGERTLTVPKFQTTVVDFDMVLTYSFTYVNHPRHNDWKVSFESTTTEPSSIEISIVPVEPFYYLTNTFNTINQQINFQNATVADVDFNGEFKWVSFNINENIDDFENFTISGYDVPRVYDVGISRELNGTVFNNYNPRAINILEEYPVYDLEINRNLGDVIEKLPHSCGFGSNDWLTHDNINNTFKKIQDNLTFLIKQSKIYLEPPAQYVGWLGTVNINGGTQTRWFVNQPGLEYMFNEPGYDDIGNHRYLKDIKDCIVRNNQMYISNGKEVFVINDTLKPFEQSITRQSQKAPNASFENITNIQFDVYDPNRLYLLDTDTDHILIFDISTSNTLNGWSLLFDWGGLGTAEELYRFNNPQDLLVDSFNNIYVADTDNYCVKKYSRTGMWLNTIHLDFKPVSICEDNEHQLHILSKHDNNIHVYKNDTFKEVFQITNINSTLKKIRASKDDYFIYGISTEDAIKTTTNGELQQKFNRFDLVPEYEFNNTSLYHDEFRNFYLCQPNCIIKYVDMVNTLSLIDDAPLNNMWKIEDIYIHKDEYIQDWVINRAINRLWDNIEIVRRSLLGKISYQREIITRQRRADDFDPPPSFDVCKIDWLPGFTDVNFETDTFCYFYPVLRTFLVHEYLLPVHPKENVFIGINEKVTADVLNRVLCQLHDNLSIIQDMIQEPADKTDELCDGISVPVIDIPDPLRESISACYPEIFQHIQP